MQGCSDALLITGGDRVADYSARAITSGAVRSALAADELSTVDGKERGDLATGFHTDLGSL